MVGCLTTFMPTFSFAILLSTDCTFTSASHLHYINLHHYMYFFNSVVHVIVIVTWLPFWKGSGSRYLLVFCFVMLWCTELEVLVMVEDNP